MTDADLVGFMATFRDVARVFPIRGDVEDLGASYFRALRPYPIRDIQAGADVCIQRYRHFPKPAEWIEAIPTRPQTVHVPVMTHDQAEAYHRAERLRYEDAPCRCKACKEAHVDWKPLRFVPEFTSQDTDRKVRDPLTDRIVTAGHWAHGQELAGYYRARGEFYAKFHAFMERRVLTHRTRRDVKRLQSGDAE